MLEREISHPEYVSDRAQKLERGMHLLRKAELYRKNAGGNVGMHFVSVQDPEQTQQRVEINQDLIRGIKQINMTLYMDLHDAGEIGQETARQTVLSVKAAWNEPLTAVKPLGGKG